MSNVNEIMRINKGSLLNMGRIIITYNRGFFKLMRES